MICRLPTYVWQTLERGGKHKVLGPDSYTLLGQIPRVDWIVVRCGSNNWHEKRHVLELSTSPNLLSTLASRFHN